MTEPITSYAAIMRRVACYHLARHAARTQLRDCCTSLPFTPDVRASSGPRPVRCGRCGRVIPRRTWRRLHDLGVVGCPTDNLLPGEHLSPEQVLNRHDRAHHVDCGQAQCGHPRGTHTGTGGNACLLAGCACKQYRPSWDQGRRRDVPPSNMDWGSVDEVDLHPRPRASDQGQEASTAAEVEGPATAPETEAGGTRRPPCPANMVEREEAIGAR